MRKTICCVSLALLLAGAAAISRGAKKQNSWHRNRTRRTCAILLAAIILTLVGCLSPSVTIKDKQPVQVPLSTYRVVAVDVLTTGKETGSVTISDELLGAIVNSLRRKNLFRQVYSKSATLKTEFDLVVSVKPAGRYNADIAQAWLGIAGGRSSMEVDVELIDGKTGEVIGSSAIDGNAAIKTTLFTSSSMSQAIEIVGDQIADYVAQNY